MWCIICTINIADNITTHKHVGPTVQHLSVRSSTIVPKEDFVSSTTNSSIGGVVKNIIRSSIDTADIVWGQNITPCSGCTVFIDIIVEHVASSCFIGLG